MPFTVQPDLIKAAWTAGKNVISEKPIAKDVATAKELVALWEETYKPQGIQWHIAEQYPVGWQTTFGDKKLYAVFERKADSSFHACLLVIYSTSRAISKCVN